MGFIPHPVPCAGMHTFYSVYRLAAQVNMTDAIPQSSVVQPAQQVVSTFDVS